MGALLVAIAPGRLAWAAQAPTQRTAGRTPVLGVQLRVADGGVLVTSLVAGGAAQRAGIQPGDRIESIDGQKVATIEEIQARLRAHTQAGGVKVAINRGGKTISLDVSAVAENRPRHRAVIGAKLADRPGHVALAAIKPKGPAREAGLQPDDRILAVDGRPVANMQQMLAVLAGHQPNEPVDLLVERNGWKRNFVFKLGDRQLLSAMTENIPPAPPPQVTNVPAVPPVDEQIYDESNVNRRALDSDFD